MLLLSGSPLNHVFWGKSGPDSTGCHNPLDGFVENERWAKASEAVFAVAAAKNVQNSRLCLCISHNFLYMNAYKYIENNKLELKFSIYWSPYRKMRQSILYTRESPLLIFGWQPSKN